MQVWVDCRNSMDDPERVVAVLRDSLYHFGREARATGILADRKTIITLAKSNSRWTEFNEHCEPGWQFRTFFGVDLASTELVATGVFVIEVECLGIPVADVAEWGVPASGGKARPPRVAMYGPKDADKEKEKQDEPSNPRELDSKPDEADNQKRDDILRKIFS